MTLLHVASLSPALLVRYRIPRDVDLGAIGKANHGHCQDLHQE